MGIKKKETGKVNSPVGVRFNQELLTELRKINPEITNQDAIKIYEKSHIQLMEIKKIGRVWIKSLLKNELLRTSFESKKNSKK